MFKLTSQTAGSVKCYDNGNVLAWESPRADSTASLMSMSGLTLCEAKTFPMETITAAEYVVRGRCIAAIGTAKVTNETQKQTDAATPRQEAHTPTTTIQQGLFLSNTTPKGGDFKVIESRSPLTRLLQLGDYVVVATADGSCTFLRVSKSVRSRVVAAEEDSDAAEAKLPYIVGKIELDTLGDWCAYTSHSGRLFLFAYCRGSNISVVEVSSTGLHRCGTCDASHVQSIRIRGGRQPELWMCGGTTVSVVPFTEQEGKIKFATQARYTLPEGDHGSVIYSAVQNGMLFIARSILDAQGHIAKGQSLAVAAMFYEAGKVSVKNETTMTTSAELKLLSRYQGTWMGVGIDNAQHPFVSPLNAPSTPPTNSEAELTTITELITSAASDATKYSTPQETLSVGISGLLHAQDKLRAVATRADSTIPYAHSSIEGPMADAVVAFTRLRLWHFYLECGLSASDLDIKVDFSWMREKHIEANISLREIAHSTLRLSNLVNSEAAAILDARAWPARHTLILESLLDQVLANFQPEQFTLRTFVYGVSSLTQDTVVAAIVVAALIRMQKGEEQPMPKVHDCAVPLVETAGFRQHLVFWASTIFIADAWLFADEVADPNYILSAVSTVEYDFGASVSVDVFNSLVAAPQYISTASTLVPAILAHHSRGALNERTGLRILLVSYLSGNAALVAHAAKLSRGTIWRGWALEVVAQTAVDVRSASILGGVLDPSLGSTFYHEMAIVERALRQTDTAGETVLVEFLVAYHRYGDALAIAEKSGLPNQASVANSLAMLVGRRVTHAEE